MKLLLKIILLFLLINIPACYFEMGRDNMNDPDSGNYKPPVIQASFMPSAISGYVPLTVDFHDRSVGNIETYEWDFNNDGITDSTDQNPTYKFNKADRYEVKLKITTRQGLVTDEAVKTVSVTFCMPERQVISEAVDGPYVIYPADIDNDGDIDIICSYSRNSAYEDNKLSWWENINNGSDWTEHIIAEADSINYLFAISIHAADINKDGDIDIAAARYSMDRIVWWENNGAGSSWTEHIVKSDFNRACSVYADDINRDGHIDLIGASNGIESETENDWENSDIIWFQNTDGTGLSWTEHLVKTDLNMASVIRSADIDRDGSTDIVAGVYGYFDEDPGIMEYAHSEIILLKNADGNGLSWTEQSIMQPDGPENSKGTRDILIEDTDNDGDMDVVSAFWLDDEIVIWENDIGTGTGWTKKTIDADFFGAQSVHAADIDNDGDMDIVGASRLGDEIAWWENIDGQWNEWMEHSVDEAFTFASSAYAADINNDGYMDIAGSANGYYNTNTGSSLAWWSVFMTDSK